MFRLNTLLSALMGNAYRFEHITFNPNLARRSGRLAGRAKSIYRGWGFNNTPYYVQLSKAERKGKSWEETRAMRIKKFKEMVKNGK